MLGGGLVARALLILRSSRLSSLPPESILVLSVYELTRRKLIQKLMRNADDEPVIVGHCFLSLTNPAGQLRTGQHSLRLFPGQGMECVAR